MFKRHLFALSLLVVAMGSAQAYDANRGYAQDVSGKVVMSGFGECWHNGSYAKSLAIPGCDAPLDGDKDGVADAADQCPDTAAGVKVDAKGCDLDSDADGVADATDRCPGTPAGKKVDAKGCVIDMDKDKDGVTNDKDKCPNTTKGAKVDADGCEVMAKFVLENVTFASGSATMTGESSAILDRVAKTLLDNPKITAIRITGYTDDRGAAKLNKALSAKRATAVMHYLASKGVDAAKMSASGMGPANPIADNATAEGRQANRRVELDVDM